MNQKTPGPLQDRIIKFLQEHGAMSPRDLVGYLNAEEGQAPTTLGSVRDTLYRRMETKGIVRKYLVTLKAVKVKEAVIEALGPSQAAIYRHLLAHGPMSLQDLVRDMAAHGATGEAVQSALYQRLAPKGLVIRMPVSYELAKKRGRK